MAKCDCTKESELAILKTDSKWIKNELIKATKKIDHMVDVFTNGEGKIAKINNTLYGNGNKENSVTHNVKNNSDYILSQKAQLRLIKGGIAVLGLSNVFLIVKLFI